MKIVKQNSQYTFKYNASLGRHGWLRLTPAYSVKMVEYVLSKLSYKPECVLEPFSGTGTTELVCAVNGIYSVAFDINPFLVWLATVKTRYYDHSLIYDFINTAYEILEIVCTCDISPYPNIYKIERWWHKPQLQFLGKLKTAIWQVENKPIADLLKIAFCRELIALSNASFNHVSTSFDNSQNENTFSEEIGKDMFKVFCSMIQDTITVSQPVAVPQILEHDSKNISNGIKGKFDTVITSPPYPNRISYIRELRPYMYWLDYLKTSNEASQLDWNTIGGTWGTATSQLAAWHMQTNRLPDYLLKIAHNISTSDNKSASLMANYVLKYFDDIAIHMQSIFNGLRENGTIHYIVGNSNFYGNTVPSEKVYADLLQNIGFSNITVEVVRKRNCNKSLYEYLISAQK